MNETYSQLKDLAKLYRGGDNANDIALSYQEQEDAVLLAYVFCKNFGLTVTITQSYFGLTDEDLASFALEELHKAMLNFKSDGGAKLVTLYSKYLKNRLRVETQSLNYDKRKSNNLTESFDGPVDEEENGASSYSNSMGYDEGRFNEIELMLSLADKVELTENEYRYCEIIVEEVSDVAQIKDSEIASRLNISSAAVHYMKKSLQKKIGIKTDLNFSLSF